MKWLVLPVIGAVVAVAVFLFARGPKPKPIDTSLTQADRPLASNPIARIEPGTRVGGGPPSGWSLLVLKTRPKVSSGDVDKVDGGLVESIRKFSTSVLGRIEPDPDRPGKFRIASFAAGLGTLVGDEDVILTTKTAAKVGVDLGFFEGMVLAEREKELDRIVCPLISTTIAIVDFPAVVARGADHVQSVMRYASLVDPKDGRVETLLWVLEPADDGYKFVGDSMICLEPNQSMDWELRVDANKFTLGMPKADAFAATSLPKGTALAAPEELKVAAAGETFSTNSSAKLEELLRKVLAGGKKP